MHGGEQWRSQGMAECGSRHTNLHKIITYFELVQIMLLKYQLLNLGCIQN